MHIKQFNKHWEKWFFYQIDFKRDYFELLKSKLDNKFILNLVWLRRVGKTTLMKQLIDYLIIEKNVNRKNIFFYSFDIFWDIKEKIDEYAKITGVDLEKEKIYVFLDEVQKVKDFQSKIKIFYDFYPNIKFILSGSSSLYLQKKESLAWRMFEIFIKPLNFREFLRFKKLDYYLDDVEIYKEKIISEFEKYVFRQFIDIIDFTDEEIFEYINSLTNKIIKEDIASYFKIDYPDILLRIFKIISSSPWMLLDYKNFANDLNIDQRTLEKYIYYLQEAFLIKKVYNYSKNLIKSERKLKKVYLETTSFCLDKQINWEIFENFVLNHLDLEYFYRFWNKEVDFIKIDNTNSTSVELTWIEVKYKSKIKKEDLKWLLHFEKKYNLKEKIIICKDCSWKINNVNLVPFYKLV